MVFSRFDVDGAFVTFDGFFDQGESYPAPFDLVTGFELLDNSKTVNSMWVPVSSLEIAIYPLAWRWCLTALSIEFRNICCKGTFDVCRAGGLRSMSVENSAGM